MMKLGVVIGRFQVPELTPGHKNVLKEAIRNSDQVLVLVGTSRVITKKNLPIVPLSS